VRFENPAPGKTEMAGAFEIRGRIKGKPVFKCCECGAGLLRLGTFSNKLRVIAPHDWEEKEREWHEHFGE
jgi:hypothetical protein